MSNGVLLFMRLMANNTGRLFNNQSTQYSQSPDPGVPLFSGYIHQPTIKSLGSKARWLTFFHRTYTTIRPYLPVILTALSQAFLVLGKFFQKLSAAFQDNLGQTNTETSPQLSHQKKQEIPCKTEINKQRVEANKAVAKSTLALIESLLEQGKPLEPNNPTHSKAIQELAKTLGAEPRSIILPGQSGKTIRLENNLTLEALNQTGNLERLRNTLKVLLYSDKHQPIIKTLPGCQKIPAYPLTIHNKWVAKQIKPSYNQQDLNNLLEILQKKGALKLNIDPDTDIPQTSELSAKEYRQMSQSKWVTDFMQTLPLLKQQDPDAVKAGLKTIAQFYAKNAHELQYFIDRPIGDAPYKNDPSHTINRLLAGDRKAIYMGMPHIFEIEKDPPVSGGFRIAPNTNMNHWRQESHFNALDQFARAIEADIIHHESWASGLSQDKIILETVGNIVSWMQAIHYERIPSSGNWEEAPFLLGLTYDTAVGVDALKITRKLMHTLKEAGKTDQSAQAVYDMLTASKNGAILADDNALNQLIKQGEARIQKTYQEEAPVKPGYTSRRYDASQAFTMTKNIRFDDNPLTDARKKMDGLTALVYYLGGKHGISRYNDTTVYIGDTAFQSGDSYLNKNSDLMLDGDGKISLHKEGLNEKLQAVGFDADCGSVAGFQFRELLSQGRQADTAQWFFDPVVSRAYGTVVQQLNKALTENKFSVKSDRFQAKALIEEAKALQIKYLNRGLARITPESEKDTANQLKSNGVLCPPNTVPEAYQAVSTIDGETVFLPGLNTPLAWAQAELYKAIVAAKEVLSIQSYLPQSD
ncbi:MAG: hypothetical protein AAGI66_02725 [Cyanobacteria bacterium P01_H01_bin.74]